MEWGSTGANVPDLEGSFSLPQGDNGDIARRSLLLESTVALYSAVGSAQRAGISEDQECNAVHQLVVANGALAASEADAFLTLISCGLEAPALIHLRALGEMSRRIAFCREYRNLALQLYKTAAPAWNRVLAKLPIEDTPALDKSQKDMRELENTDAFKKAKEDVIARFHLLNELEWTMWSKRSHGDIFSLMQVSKNLRSRDSNIRVAINKELPQGLASNGLLMRAIGFVLFTLVQIAAEFVIDTGGKVKSLLAKFKRMQSSDEASGALKVETYLVGT